MTDLNKTASTLLLKQLKGLKPSFTRNSIPDFSSTFPRDAYPTPPPPLAEVALLRDQRSWPVPGAPAPPSTEKRSALKSALAQQKLILPNRKENRTTASPVTAAQQEWYGLSRTGSFPKTPAAPTDRSDAPCAWCQEQAASLTFRGVWQQGGSGLCFSANI